ncbi:MAG: nucleotidyltransferase domain-containing protein [Patescibacteria group bacterium]
MDTKSILSDTPQHLLRKYRAVLMRKGIPVEQMILFGSYAKGKAKPWSDLDICVVSKAFGKNSYDERVMLAKLTLNVDTMIEPHPYHPRDLANHYDPLAAEIRRDGKQII